MGNHGRRTRARCLEVGDKLDEQGGGLDAGLSLLERSIPCNLLSRRHLEDNAPTK